MKKLFSLLLCVLGISSAMATPKTITIDNTNITFTDYSSNYASFSAENFSFMAKQCYKAVFNIKPMQQEKEVSIFIMKQPFRISIKLRSIFQPISAMQELLSWD